MTHTPGGFLALWNGIRDPKREAEYETWHAFEHVPERVGSPGFVWARRYAACRAGDTPTYFTLYALEGVEALLTPRYQALIDHPSAWSASMREQLTDFCREPCVTTGSHGPSEASLLAPLRLRLPDTAALSQLDAWLGQEVEAGRLVQATLGQCDGRSAHPLGHQSQADAPSGGVEAVALLSDFRRAALATAIVKLEAALPQQIAGAALRARPIVHQLQSAVRQSELPHPVDARQPPRPDLHQQFHQGDH